jgi:hypothetical protein
MIVFEDKSLADNVVVAVEKQIHYGSNENLAQQEAAENAEQVTAVEKTVAP